MNSFFCCHCDRIWYGMWAAYRGSLALAIRSRNLLFMFNPRGSGRAEQRRGEGGGLYEYPGLPTNTCQIQVGVISKRSSVHLPGSNPSSFVSSLFACQSDYAQQPAIPLHLFLSLAQTHTHAHMYARSGGGSLGLKPPPLTTEQAAGYLLDGLCS